MSSKPSSSRKKCISANQEDPHFVYQAIKKAISALGKIILGDDTLRQDAVTRRCHSFAQRLWVIRNAATVRTANPATPPEKQLRNVIHSPLVIESMVWDMLVAVRQDGNTVNDAEVKEIFGVLFDALTNVAILREFPLKLPSSVSGEGIKIIKCMFYHHHLIDQLNDNLKSYQSLFGRKFNVVKFNPRDRKYQINKYLADQFRNHTDFKNFLNNNFLQWELPNNRNLIFVSAISLNIEFPKFSNQAEYGAFTVKNDERNVRKVSFIQKVKHVEIISQQKEITSESDPFETGTGGGNFEAIGINMEIEGNNLVLMIMHPTGKHTPDDIPLSHLERVIAQIYPGKEKCPEAKLFPNILGKKEKLMKISLPVFSLYDKFIKLKEAFQLMGMHQPFETQTQHFTNLMQLVGSESESTEYGMESIFHAASLKISESGGDGNCLDKLTVPPDADLPTFNVSRPFFFAVIYAKKYILLHGAIHDFNFLQVQGETDRAEPFVQDDEIGEMYPIELEKLGVQSETPRSSKKGTPKGSPRKFRTESSSGQSPQHSKPGSLMGSPVKKPKI